MFVSGKEEKDKEERLWLYNIRRVVFVSDKEERLYIS